jgi:hypothetical protein
LADFPRTVPPARVTYPKVIGSLVSVGQSGALQTRSEAAQGRVWQEAWSALAAGNEDVQELITTIENLYNTGATCTLTHYLLPGSGKAAHGAGGGSPLVKGASQSGTSLITDGWTASRTGVMKAGDCFTIAGVDVLFRVTADANSDGSGDSTLSILPPIVAGSSPADNAALTIASAKITAIVLDYTDSTAGPDEFIGGLSVTFREAP